LRDDSKIKKREESIIKQLQNNKLDSDVDEEIEKPKSNKLKKLRKNASSESDQEMKD
jgi:hypothetical protein